VSASFPPQKPTMSEAPSTLSRYLKKVLVFVLVFVCACAVLTAFWAESKTRTHRVTYRLVPASGKPTGKMLSVTRQVLSARLQNLERRFELRGCKVEVVSDDEVQVRFRTRLEPDELLEWLKIQGRAEFRLLHPDPGILNGGGPEQLPEGYELKTYREVRYLLGRPGKLETTERHYAVANKASVEVSGFQSVSLETRGIRKRTILTFELPQPEAESLRRLTVLNAGRQMAMLVDGELFFPPRQIRGPIAGTKVQVAGYFYNPPLRKLVKVLSAGTLPCALEQVSHEKT